MLPCLYFYCFFFFFFNDTATTEIYPLSLHDALPIPTTASTWDAGNRLTQTVNSIAGTITRTYDGFDRLASEDRKSTRLNSSHGYISYAVFCLKKKKK